MSLWDVFKDAKDEAFAGQSLLKVFTDLPRKGVALGAAGKLYSAEACERAIESGLDFVLVGRAAVIHADFPRQALTNADFEMHSLPVTREHLAAQGLGPRFIDYMATWDGFVAA
jgi:2,4-dienoyl-CoA reductase-like NADH-dependent reductase (Old Yellow Enzyme family)